MDQEKIRLAAPRLREHVDVLLAAVRQANLVFPHRVDDQASESPAAAAWHNSFYQAAEEHDILGRTVALEARLSKIQQLIAEDADPDCSAFLSAWCGVMEVGDELAALARWSDETRRKIAQAVAELN